MLRRYLSCRSRPDPDLIRENILNSNGEREKKGSLFSLFLPSFSEIIYTIYRKTFPN